MSGGYEDLRAALPDDVWLTHDVDPEQVTRTVTAGPAAAWLSRHPIRQEAWLTAVGDVPRDVAELATDLFADTRRHPDRVAGLTITTAAEHLLPESIRVPDAESWTWWWTDREPPPCSGEDQVVALADDDPRLPGLLRESGSVYVVPGDQRIVGWAGIPVDGELVACGAWTQHIRGVPHLASVVTRPDRRGQGLSTAVCGWLVRRALARDGIATLGMYAGNRAARRVYEKLGFVMDKAFTSGHLPDDERVGLSHVHEPGPTRPKGDAGA